MSKQSFFLAVLYFKIDFQILEWDFVPFWINNLLFKNFVSRCLWWPLGIDVLSNFWYIWDIQHYGTQGYLTQWDLFSYPPNIAQWGWSPRKFRDKFGVFCVVGAGQVSLVTCIINHEWFSCNWMKNGPFFSKFCIQNWQFQGIKKLGDLITPHGFWKLLEVV